MYMCFLERKINLIFLYVFCIFPFNLYFFEFYVFGGLYFLISLTARLLSCHDGRGIKFEAE